MAKKSTKKTAGQKFLADIASDAHKLGEFILDPEGAMDKANISKEERPHIKNAIAVFASGKLLPAKAYDLTFVTGVEEEP